MTVRPTENIPQKSEPLVRRAWVLLWLYAATLLALSGLLLGLVLWFRQLPFFSLYLLIPQAFLIAILLTLWWAAFPRRLPLPAGILLDTQRQPELEHLIQDTASKLGAPLPDEVRLLPDMNAYASERGWVKPIRTLGLGFPLISVLSREELQAVIAHELGHLSYGDSRATWRLAVARQSLIRTVTTADQTHLLEEETSPIIMAYRALITLISVPLSTLARAYLQTTSTLSHLQEHRADAASSLVAGQAVVTTALNKVALNTHIFDAFVFNHLQPLAESGWQMPIAEGFEVYRQSAEAEAQRRYTTQKNDPDEASLSHPSLRARLGHISEVAAPTQATAGTPLTLLDAENLTAQFYRHNKKHPLSPSSWQALNDHYWPEQFAKNLEARDAQIMLGDLRLSDVADVCGDLNNYLRKRLVQLTYEGVGGDERNYAIWLFEQAIALALHSQGWQFDLRPGHPIRMVCGQQSAEPRALLWEMVRSPAACAAWPATLTRYGVIDASLRP